MTDSQTKRQVRKELFRKLGQALTDYHTGLESQFEIKGKCVHDPTLSSRLCGPRMKTLQFERTVKK